MGGDTSLVARNFRLSTVSCSRIGSLVDASRLCRKYSGLGGDLLVADTKWKLVFVVADHFWIHRDLLNACKTPSYTSLISIGTRAASRLSMSRSYSRVYNAKGGGRTVCFAVTPARGGTSRAYSHSCFSVLFVFAVLFEITPLYRATVCIAKERTTVRY